LNGATSYPFRLRQEGLLRAAAWLDREPITIYHSVPSTFRAIAALEGDFGQVRVVRLEGDRATSADVELWKRRFPEHCLLANGLGTTETGLACQLVVTRAGVVPQGVLPVGYATRDMTVHLVDDARDPVSPGEVGEIAVASNFLALGYWDQPELTAERFAEWGDSRVYFTGDLGRAMEDGCVEYVGRREDDLKVLGQRVEPAEIERELLRSPDVRDVAVTVREGARGDGQVVAYAVPRGSARLDLRSLRVTLAEVLPSAALPTALVELQELPLGPNGKIDRRALPDPDATPVGRSPMSAPEVWLAALWADVLNVEHVSADDDFFALGGDSLAGAQITAQIALETGHSLTLGALVRAPTVRQLAELVSQPEAASPSTLTVLRPGDGWPPLLLVHGNTGNTVHYAALVRATGDRRPLWGLEYLEPGADVSVDAVVGAHLVALRRALPEGPYLVAGFCYGGGIALEMAGRLAAEGHEAHVALLGITPLELPSLVSPDAYRRWRHVAGPRPPLLDRVRYHGGVAARAPRRELPRYLALRIRNLARRTIARASHDVSDTSSVARAAQEALASHRPSPFPGRPLVVLHEEDTALYSSDPERDWAALGSEGIELVIAPGSTHSMLESDNASALADVLTTWTADASGESKTR